jgi:hypothetical protein
MEAQDINDLVLDLELDVQRFQERTFQNMCNSVGAGRLAHADGLEWMLGTQCLEDLVNHAAFGGKGYAHRAKNGPAILERSLGHAPLVSFKQLDVKSPRAPNLYLIVGAIDLRLKAFVLRYVSLLCRK